MRRVRLLELPLCEYFLWLVNSVCFARDNVHIHIIEVVHLYAVLLYIQCK